MLDDVSNNCITLRVPGGSSIISMSILGKDYPEVSCSLIKLKILALVLIFIYSAVLV